jgi:hypothetical protein
MQHAQRSVQGGGCPLQPILDGLVPRTKMEQGTGPYLANALQLLADDTKALAEAIPERLRFGRNPVPDALRVYLSFDFP